MLVRNADFTCQNICEVQVITAQFSSWLKDSEIGWPLHKLNDNNFHLSKTFPDFFSSAEVMTRQTDFYHTE